jgi:Skp family chaperone for outer membrane proteins
MNFKQAEIEQENKTLHNQINKLKLEVETLIETLEKTQKEKMHLNKRKSEIDDINDSTKRELVKKVQANLSNLLLVMTKMKKKYNQEIYKISTELEKLQNSYESKILSC